MMRVLVAPQNITRPYLAPPGLPAERVRELRDGFIAALKDPVLVAEFTKVMGEEPSPTHGADMQKILVDMYATPPDVVAKLKAVLGGAK